MTGRPTARAKRGNGCDVLCRCRVLSLRGGLPRDRGVNALAIEGATPLAKEGRALRCPAIRRVAHADQARGEREHGATCAAIPYPYYCEIGRSRRCPVRGGGPQRHRLGRASRKDGSRQAAPRAALRAFLGDPEEDARSVVRGSNISGHHRPNALRRGHG